MDKLTQKAGGHAPAISTLIPSGLPSIQFGGIMKNKTIEARRNWIIGLLGQSKLLCDAEMLDLEAELFQIENAPLSGDWR